MRACVLTLIFMGILKLNLCHLRTAEASDEDGPAWEIPFGQAKVKYHRSRYCITAFGQEHCVHMNEEPADPAKIARLYRMWMKGYEPNFKSALKKSPLNTLKGRKKKLNEREFEFDEKYLPER